MTVEELHKLWEKKNKGKADVSEHTLQTKCVRWFRLKYPQYLIYSIPNGGYRTKTTARLMRAEGQVSGILDLHIPIAKHGYHSMYIEMKNGKQGRLSDNQKEMIERLRSYGNKVVVCHNIDEFMKEVDEYLTE